MKSPCPQASSGSRLSWLISNHAKSQGCDTPGTESRLQIQAAVNLFTWWAVVSYSHFLSQASLHLNRSLTGTTGFQPRQPYLAALNWAAVICNFFPFSKQLETGLADHGTSTELYKETEGGVASVVAGDQNADTCSSALIGTESSWFIYRESAPDDEH